MSDRIAQEIRRYLKTGEHDHDYRAWPGNTFLERAQRGRNDLQNAMLAEVRSRQKGIRTRALPRGLDPLEFARGKLAPMVRGLFPRVEQPTVLDVLARSVVFVHRGNVERLLKELSFDIDAWRLANMYLYSVGAKPLHGAKSAHVGMGIHKTSYVSMLYFGRTGPFEDFVIHEAAHVFHNCKRRTIGLREIRHREWLLPIAFVKREIFAYTCEAYGRILEQSKSPAERKALFAQYAGGHVPSLGEDRAEHLDILESAVAVRNGWKEILRRCHEPKPLTRKEFFARMMAEARGRVAS